MKTEKVVYIQNGEIQGTWGVHKFLDNFEGDLQQTCTRLLSHDMWEPVTVPLYKVVNVKMPIWMRESDFQHHHINLRFAEALGGDFVYHYNETQFINFSKLGERWQFFIGWLEEKRGGRSVFMNSIINQVDAWLAEAPEKHKYGSPLSIRQFEIAAKYCPLYNAKKISTRVYWQR